MAIARVLMRPAGGGVTLLALAVLMPDSHRGFLTILGLTRRVVHQARSKLLYVFHGNLANILGFESGIKGNESKVSS